MRRSIVIAMKGNLWLCVAAVVAYGTPAFAETLAYLEAAVTTAQATYDAADTAHAESIAELGVAKAAVDVAKAERTRLKAERDATEKGTPERKAAQAALEAAVDVLVLAREVRDAAQNTFAQTRYDKGQATIALREAEEARDAYLATPAGRQEAQVAQLESQIADLESQRDTLQTALQAANADTLTAQAERDALQAELDVVNTALETAMENLVIADEELTTLKNELALAEITQTELQEELQAVEDEAEEKQAEIEELQADYADMGDLFDDVAAGCVPVKDDVGAWTVNTDTVHCVPLEALWADECINTNSFGVTVYRKTKVTVMGTALTDFVVLSGAGDSGGLPFGYRTPDAIYLFTTETWNWAVQDAETMHQPYNILLRGQANSLMHINIWAPGIRKGEFDLLTDFLETPSGQVATPAALEDIRKLADQVEIILDGRADEIPAVPMCP